MLPPSEQGLHLDGDGVAKALGGDEVAAVQWRWGWRLEIATATCQVYPHVILKYKPHYTKHALDTDCYNMNQMRCW